MSSAGIPWGGGGGGEGGIKITLRFQRNRLSSKKDANMAIVLPEVRGGCTWVGTVGTLEKHVATCKFTLLPCPKECRRSHSRLT